MQQNANERHNVEVFKKALKLYREHLVRAREEVRAAKGSDKRHGREIDAN